MNTKAKTMGRPPGKTAIIPKTFRLREDDARRLVELKELWGCSEASVIRRLLLDAARREGLGDGSSGGNAERRIVFNIPAPEPVSPDEGKILIPRTVVVKDRSGGGGE